VGTKHQYEAVDRMGMFSPGGLKTAWPGAFQGIAEADAMR